MAERLPGILYDILSSLCDLWNTLSGPGGNSRFRRNDEKKTTLVGLSESSQWPHAALTRESLKESTVDD